MFIDAIIIILLLIALYCGGMWTWIARVTIRDRRLMNRDDLIELERQTFHLGLCLVLAIGFIGLTAGAR